MAAVAPSCKDTESVGHAVKDKGNDKDQLQQNGIGGHIIHAHGIAGSGEKIVDAEKAYCADHKVGLHFQQRAKAAKF